MDGSGKVIRSSFSIISMFSVFERLEATVSSYTFDETLGHDSGAARARLVLSRRVFLDHEIRLPTSKATRQMTPLSPPMPSAGDFLMGLNKQILKPLSLYKARKEYTRDRARDCTQLV